MLTCMRTTIILDDALLREARIRAAEQDLTLSDVVNAALRDTFRRGKEPNPPFRMITFGPQEPQVAHEPADFAAVEELDIRSALGR